MIRYISVHFYNKDRSQPVTIQCINTWVGAPVDRRRLTGMICPKRTLISVWIIVPFFCTASSPLSISHQLILVIDCLITLDNNPNPSGFSHMLHIYTLRTSWDLSMATCVDLTSPGVVVLDTTVVPDVVGLHAFNDQAHVVRVLPGDFGNTVRVLVPDVRAEPHGLHDLLIDNLSGTKACHVRPVSAGDLTALKRHWPSSLLSAMTKRQADMESLRRDCKRKFDSEDGNGRPRNCPRPGGLHALQPQSHSLPMSRQPMSCSRLTLMFRCPRRGVLRLRSPWGSASINLPVSQV